MSSSALAVADTAPLLSQLSRDSMPAISVRGVSKSYMLYEKPIDRLKQMIWRNRRRFGKEVCVLENISFDVYAGQSIGIIGVNGAGKSTLLQIICGTVTPNGGSVTLNGRVAALLELGAGFNPEFNGRENVFMNGGILGLTDQQIHERMDKILAFADIGDFIDMPVKTYSSGMYVRLAFAVAAHVDPEILIVDEALSVGDFLFQQKCNKFLQENLADTTKIFVTHDFGAVTRLTDRVLVLDQGRIIYDGKPAEAIERYQIAARRNENNKMVAGSGNAPAPIRQPGVATAIDWIAIPQDKLSGRHRAHFEAFTFSVGGLCGRAHITNGDTLTVRARVVCSDEVAEPIIGYQIQDRFGTVLFGENSKSIASVLPPLEKGAHQILFSVQWPMLAPDKYSLTIGIGNGNDPIAHEIECWAHNIIVLNSSSTAPVHGIFNVPFQKLDISSCEIV